MTQVDDKETEFPFDSLQETAIIVVMGLPFTRTEMVAGRIGRWARCPVLILDDFLDFMSEEAGYGVNSLPSREEAERLNHRAMDHLCRVARRHLDSSFSGLKCVVIKCPPICSTYELQRLLPLTLEKSDYYSKSNPLILLECRLGNEYQWKQNFLNKGSREKWYEARDWNGIEKAKEDYNAQAFDLLLLQLGNLDVLPPRFRRLVVDPHYDLNHRSNYYRTFGPGHITPSLASAIKFLLTAGEQELNKKIPQTVELRQLRRYLMEKKIAAAASGSRQRRKYFCVGGACVFKYWESLIEDSSSCTCSSSCCGVCKEPLVIGEAAYSCYFCFLALHKYHNIGRACKSCKEAGQVLFSYFCASCRFQTYLKSRRIPTIILNPDFHEHMISLQFKCDDVLTCKGCGWLTGSLDSMYGCSICETYYHSYCSFWPKKFKHEHGGHEHLMKLMLSRDGAEEEEDYWCDICYQDIDPQVWFYSCQHCPYYAAHLHCTLGYV